MRKVYAPVDKGLNYEVPAIMVPDGQWANGSNVRFGSGYVEKSGGWTKMFATALDGAVIHMSEYVPQVGDSVLMIGTPKSLYKFVDGDSAPVKITGSDLSGTANDPCHSVTIDGVLYYSNNIDKVKIWPGSGTAKNAPGMTTGATRANSTAYEKYDTILVSGKNWLCTTAGTSASSAPSFDGTSNVTDGGVVWEYIGISGLEGGGSQVNSCHCIASYAGFLFVGGTVEDGVNYPNRIRWSQWQEPWRWKNNDDGSGQAGYVDLNDSYDEIKSIVPLGDYLVIYKKKSISLLSYVGGTYVFNQRQIVSGIGLVSPGAIADIDGVHVFVGEDNIYSYDLVSPKAIGSNIKDEFFRQANRRLLETCSASLFNKGTHEATFSFASSESTQYNDKAISYNVKTGAWSIRNVPAQAMACYVRTNDEQWDTDEEPWDTDETTWFDATLMDNSSVYAFGDKDGYLYRFEGNSADGSDYEFHLDTKLEDFGDPTKYKRVKRIQLMSPLSNETDVYVQVGTANNAGDEIVWGEKCLIHLSETTKSWADVDVTAVYFSFRLSNEEQNQPVRVSGMIVTYEERGAA